MTVMLGLSRLPDWQLRLQEFVRARQSAPFQWGENDCCMFAADAVLAVTGVDPALHLRGSYSTAQEAASILRDYGGIENLVTAFMGPPVPVLMARVGDLVSVEIEGRVAVGVCNGTTVIGPSPSGLATASWNAGRSAWRVG